MEQKAPIAGIVKNYLFFPIGCVWYQSVRNKSLGIKANGHSWVANMGAKKILSNGSF